MLTLAAPAFATDECPSGLFGVAAQIVRVDPPHGTVEKTIASGQKVNVGANDLICVGEELLVPGSGPVKTVELFVDGHKQVLTPSGRFMQPDSTIVYAARALVYLSDLVQGTRTLSAPLDIPDSTSARGANPAIPAPTLQIQAMRLLRGLPRQNITPDMQPVISWRDGTSPYACQAISEDGDVIWAAKAQDNASWCRLAADLGQAAQLLVKDAVGQVESWNIKPVTWDAVPRPDWLASSPGEMSGADRTAWALWLWRVQDKRWRLQALSMLDELAKSQWVAGYLRNNLLAGSDRFDL